MKFTATGITVPIASSTSAASIARRSTRRVISPTNPACRAILGWPIARSLLRIATLKRAAVLTCALALTIVGVYSMRQSLFDVKVMLICGFVGYFMLRYGYSTAAAAIAVVLGAGAERSLRTGLNLTSNDWFAFVSRPITAAILTVALLFLIYGIWGTIRQYRMAQADTPASPSQNNAGSRYHE